MKCERCGKRAEGYDLHDYCAVCGKNLCEACMHAGRCADADGKKHQPANHGEEA